MKKLFILIFSIAAFSSQTMLGQATIVFKVDISTFLSNGGTITADGVHMAGNFTTSGGNLPDWTPISGPMVNEGNNIWSRTVIFNGTAVDSLQWKYVRGNAWVAGDEGSSWFPPNNTCAIPTSNNNRKILLPSSGNWIVNSEWARCATITQVFNSVPTVLTTGASSITQTSFSGVGFVASDGGSPVTTRGICYSTSPNPTIANNILASGNGLGSYSSDISGLTPNTVYYFKAYATNSNGTAYGTELNIRTQPAAIQTFTVTYKVDITNYLAGGATLASRGIRIAGDFRDRGTTLPNWLPTDTLCAMTNEGNNVWSITVTYPDTVAGRIQRYKFVNGNWGQNEGSATSNILTGGCGVLDGADINRTFSLTNQNSTVRFCWDQCEATCSTFVVTPAVTTGTATNITQTGATISGNVTADGGSAVTARGICYATTTNPTIANSIAASGTGTGSFSATLTGLTENTVYYARAYATNIQGTAYGAQIEFRTLATGIQTFTVTYKVDVTNYIAGGATIASNGIRIAGDFADRGTNLPNWNPTAAACALTNEGNNIWSIVVTYPDSVAGRVQRYKFVNGNWGQNEGLTGSNIATNGCGVVDGADINRTLTLANANATAIFCWDQCTPSCTSVQLPTVTTTNASIITNVSANLGGNVIAEGSSAVTARGVCWSTNPQPTIDLPTRLTIGAGLGNFEGIATGLTAGTLYYVRAFATNASGTFYGNEITFRTLGGSNGPTVIFRIDIVNFLAGGGIINNIVSIAGNFADRGGDLPNWTPPSGAMTESSPNVWERVIQFDGTATDSLQWKYVQGANWTDGDEGNDWAPPLDASCIRVTDNNNRKLLLPPNGRWLFFSEWARCGTFTPSTFIPIHEGSIAFSLFPNPANDKVTIVLPEYQNPTIKILGMDGKTLDSKIISKQSGQFNIQTSGLQPGKYMVLLLDNGKFEKASFTVIR